jgi:hypothetical protein
MTERAETELASYENLVLTDRGIRQRAIGDGVRIKAFIPTHAIADYQETTSQNNSLLVWALILFAVLVAVDNQPSGFMHDFLRRANLLEIPLVFQYEKGIAAGLLLAVLLLSVYLFYRFFKTRYHSIKIHSISGFSISEVNKSFLFFPNATEFLEKLEAEIRSSRTR